ncbi:hypothetical protein QUA27_25465 [Microcoleus sp. Pol14C6]|uniref:hypothetical protein n=1 Tax=unclassified Microcoleus TaxID=2642155 RepID=UPI002FD34C85
MSRSFSTSSDIISVASAFVGFFVGGGLGAGGKGLAVERLSLFAIGAADREQTLARPKST